MIECQNFKLGTALQTAIYLQHKSESLAIFNRVIPEMEFDPELR